jgi:tetratricopeptide (TPR) repeat protein
MLGFLSILFWVLIRRPRAQGIGALDPDHAGTEPTVRAGATAALAAVLTQGLVDFPLHLPSHAALFWVNAGLLVAVSLPGPSGAAPQALVRGSLRRGIAMAAAALAGALTVSAVVQIAAERHASSAVTYNRSGNVEKAIEEARWATRLAGHEHEYWVLLAETTHKARASGHRDITTLRAAFNAYRKAARTRPYHAPTYGRTGALYLSDVGVLPAALDSAMVNLERAVSLNPYYADPHTNLGTAHTFLGNDGLAREEFTRAAELDTLSPDPLFNLGNLESSRGRTAEGIESYGAALERDPDHFGSLFNMGALLTARGQREEAVPYLERAVELRPDSEHARALLGTARGDASLRRE